MDSVENNFIAQKMRFKDQNIANNQSYQIKCKEV